MNASWTGRARPLALVVATVLGLLTGCAKPADRAAATAAATAAAQAAADEGSLYELDFALTDADGHTRHLSDFRGQPFVASMIYTNCTSVCPRVTADLQALDGALPPVLQEKVRFVLVSLDPERDTPAALREFATAHQLDPARWTLLAAGADDMRTLAAVLGVRYRPDGAGEIAHSALIAVVDGGGVIRHRQVGTVDDRSELVAAVERVFP
jgi:protein SCO1/2